MQRKTEDKTEDETGAKDFAGTQFEPGQYAGLHWKPDCGGIEV